MADKRLLIVEDDKEIADLMFRVALEEGFDARITSSNISLVTDYEKFCPDVIVLDILMPDVDGFEVLQFLAGRESKAYIVISSGQPSYSEMARKLGGSLQLTVVDTILKPFRIAEIRRIFSTIKHTLSLHRDAPPEEHIQRLHKKT